MKKYIKIILVFILLMLLIGCNKIGNKPNPETNDFTYLLEKETGKDSDGNIIYEIFYSYDENGNEIERIAYHENLEDDFWLSLACDQIGIEEKIYIEPTRIKEEEQYYIVNLVFDLVYNEDGYLVKALPSDSQDFYGVSVIEYSYILHKTVIQEETYETELGELDYEMTLEEKIINSNGIINVDGEQCYAIWGETGALIWKYVGATFEDDEHYLYAMAKDVKEIEMSEAGTEEWDACRYTDWSVLYDIQYFDFYHVGDDMFAMPFTHLYYNDYYQEYRERERFIYINGNDQITFFDYNSCIKESDFLDRITEFNDGYAFFKYDQFRTFDKPAVIAVMDKYGNLTISDITISDYFDKIEEIPCGTYSDGLFYYYYAFYDIDFNKVVSLNGDIGTPYVSQGIYTPHYKNGICSLITMKNGLYWIFDIDKNGEIISEIEEFDIYSLDI